MARDEFSKEIIRRLAQRAGYQCSICERITVGPSAESPTSVNITGIGAHITAASPGPGARRYDPNLSAQERSSIDNGIWLCNTHADLIDGDEVTYTTAYLKTIKNNHEQKIKLRHSGISTNKGVITKITLSNFGEVKKNLVLEFADNNIIKGGNGVGKTLILELIASLANDKVMKRWVNEYRPKVNSFYTIDYFKNQPEKFTVSVDKNNHFSYEYNEALIPFLAPSMTIIFLKKDYGSYEYSLKDKVKEKSSNIDILAKYFKLKKKEFIGVVNSTTRNIKFFCNDIDIDIENDMLMVNISGSHSFPFKSLSTGEKTRVILELTLKIAVYYSKFNSTILLIDNEAFPTLDKTGVDNLFKVIRSEKFNFQFMFTTLGDEDYDYLDFKIHHLESVNGQTVLAQ